MSVVSQSTANDCNLRRIDNMAIEVGNSTNESVGTELAFIKTMSMQDLTIGHQPVLVLSDDQLTISHPKIKDEIIIDGIIGWDIIRNIYLEIDYQKNGVTIAKPKLTKLRRNESFFLRLSHCQSEGGGSDTTIFWVGYRRE